MKFLLKEFQFVMSLKIWRSMVNAMLLCQRRYKYVTLTNYDVILMSKVMSPKQHSANVLTTPPGRVAQSVGHLTRKSGVLGSIPGLATYFRFSFRFFKKGSCQLLAKVCARSTG